MRFVLANQHLPIQVNGKIYEPCSWRSTILGWVGQLCSKLLNEVSFVRVGVKTYRIVDLQEQGRAALV